MGADDYQLAMPRFSARVGADIDEIIQRVGADLQKLSGTTLLVTGASGFLCSYFVDVVAKLNEELLRPPCQVIAVDNMQVGVADRLAHLEGRDDIRFVQHDVTQPLEVGPVDWIIHGASIASPVFYRRFPLETIATNVNGTWQLLELSRRQQLRGLLYLSTSEIYGDPDPASIPTSEEYLGQVSCTGPRACYDESKRVAETLCMTYNRLYQTPVNIVRPFNVYGPGQRLDDGRIIPDLIGAAVRRGSFVIYSDGRATRSFCYVSDAVCAIWHILLGEMNGEVFNIGNDQEEIEIGKLAERVRQVAGPPWLEIQHTASQDAHFLTDNPQRRCPDLGKLRQQFPWEPKVDLTEGIQRTLTANLELLAAVEQVAAQP